jgi:formylglycine-generating enzyme required for sulfatase activity
MSFKTGKQLEPPGTIAFKEHLFVDKTEVRVVDWKEYMWSKNSHWTDFSDFEILPDTTIWRNNLGVSIRTYLSDLQYNDYPIVGVTYEQALEYCKWRTEQVNKILYAKKYGIKQSEIDTSIKIPKFVEYDLPTKEEWEEISQGATNFTTNQLLAVDSNRDSKTKFCNLMGNVSEMVKEKGLAKGTNWKESNKPINEDFHYDKPADWLGFRCICRILED